jgi:hypothetical protein
VKRTAIVAVVFLLCACKESITIPESTTSSPTTVAAKPTSKIYPGASCASPGTKGTYKDRDYLCTKVPSDTHARWHPVVTRWTTKTIWVDPSTAKLVYVVNKTSS